MVKHETHHPATGHTATSAHKAAHVSPAGAGVTTKKNAAARVGASPKEDMRTPIALSVGFLLLVGLAIHLLFGHMPNAELLMIAGVFGGYMALNIGANDVTNNVSPAVGSKAITIVGALVIAAIFETAGSLIAGGDVVKTISKGIVEPSAFANQNVFIAAMMAALLAGAVWLNFATAVGAPVSTTHSIVGGVVGAGIAAAGVNVVKWDVMGKIAASWVISPVLGGIVAALLYAMIRKLIIDNKEERLRNAVRWVPIFIGVMASAFAMYLMMKGLKNIIHVDGFTVVLAGTIVALVSPSLVRPLILKRARRIRTNRRSDINKLFRLPLIAAAALLSFAHGANDVANAVGPLAAVVSALEGQSVAGTESVGVPLWIMIIGALGISVGLLLFGAKLVTVVGESITKLDQSRAYCVALSAALTVIVASWMGLPVSSTHIAVGAVFGIGLYREWRKHSKRVARLKANKKVKEYEHQIIRRKLVRRRHIFSIATAWVITVPLSCALAAGMYIALSAWLF